MDNFSNSTFVQLFQNILKQTTKQTKTKEIMLVRDVYIFVTLLLASFCSELLENDFENNFFTNLFKAFGENGTAPTFHSSTHYHSVSILR